MPYSNVSELPDHIKRLPAKAQRAFMQAFNSAWDGTCAKRQGPARESCAMRIGNAAAAQARRNTKEEATKVEHVEQKAITYDRETELIRESAKTDKARKPHRFVAAHWTHKNGHPRCRICGDEERIGGNCDGRATTEKGDLGDGALEELTINLRQLVPVGLTERAVSVIEKRKVNELTREYLEETMHLIQRYLPPWVIERMHRLALPRAGGRSLAAQRQQDKDELRELRSLHGMVEQALEVEFDEQVPLEVEATDDLLSVTWPWMAKAAQEEAVTVEPLWKGERTLFVRQGGKVEAPEPFREALKKLPGGDLVLCAVVLDVPERYGPIAAVYDALQWDGQSLLKQSLGVRRRLMRTAMSSLPSPMFTFTPMTVVHDASTLAATARSMTINPAAVDGIILKQNVAYDCGETDTALVVKLDGRQVEYVAFAFQRWDVTKAEGFLEEHFFDTTRMEVDDRVMRYRQRSELDFEHEKAVTQHLDLDIFKSVAPLKPEGILRSLKLIEKQSRLKQSTGIVMEPEETDAHGDVTSHVEVRQSCHQFARDYRAGRTRLRLQHKRDLTDDDVVMVENYIAPHEMVIGGQPVKAGAWVQTWQWYNEVLWSMVEAGIITGLSIGALARKRPLAAAA